MLYVSQAPLARPQAYKRRMGWSFPWVSSANNEFNFDFGASHTEAEVREHFGPMLEGDSPPVFRHLATETAPTSPDTFQRSRALTPLFSPTESSTTRTRPVPGDLGF